ncbi:MAG: serine/threonine-protein kinase [Pseudomonadota bacterium]
MRLSDDVATLFSTALEKPVEEQRRWLREQCAGNPALFAEVCSLLDAAERAPAVMDHLADGFLALAHVGGELPVAHRIGRWRVVKRVGQGGMGAVYRVARADGEYEQEAALKILPVGLDSDALRATFTQERQFLAQLQHENVAGLIDGGVTETGTPYFVMELVAGEPIDRYCDKRKLDVSSRIRLFLGVIAAVAHAHAQLIVHRDIKPSNVLVTDDGVPKLVDFGVAKLMTGGDNQRTHVRALTPDFAAPEQLRGQPITTATDVYGLGLLLFTLLAGRNPRAGVEVDSLDRFELPRLSEYATSAVGVELTNVDDLLAARSTSLKRLRRSLEGDLDTTIAKATAVEASERYATVNAFGEDLRRFLDNQPVLAQPQTVTYRMRKFVRRHRGGVLTGFATALAVLGALVIALWQSAEATRQRDEAVYQQQRVAATNQFLLVLFAELRDAEEPISNTSLLARGVELLKDNTSFDAPFAASIRSSFSLFYSALGDKDQSLALLNDAIETAREVNESRLLSSLLCSRSKIMQFSDGEAARKDLREGKALLEKANLSLTVGRVDCLEAEALVLAREDDIDGAKQRYIEALDLVAAMRPIPEFRRASLYSKLGEQFFNSDDPGKALELIAKSIDSRERLGLGHTVQALIVRLNRAAVLSRLGEIKQAAIEQAVVMQRLEQLEKPLVGASNHYGNSLLVLERLDEALNLFETDLAAAQASGNERWIAMNETQIGRVFSKMGRPAEAEAHFAIAEELFQAAGPSQERWLRTIARARIEGMLRSGDVTGAAVALDDVLAQAEYPETPPTFALAGHLLLAAECANLLQRYDQAEQFATDAYALYLDRARDATSSGFVGLALVQQMTALAGQGENTAVERLKADAERALSNGLGGDHPVLQLVNDL